MKPKLFKYVGLNCLALFALGCSSSSPSPAEKRINLLHREFYKEISVLRDKINQLEEKLASTGDVVNNLKSQRVVRLPTGAPTKIEPRSNKPARQSEAQLQNGIQSYQSGDIIAAIHTLSDFVGRYSSSPDIDKAVYYLAQSFYHQRQYQKAQNVLEQLLSKTQKNTLFVNRSKKLLHRVYQAQGISTVSKSAAKNNDLAESAPSLNMSSYRQQNVPVRPVSLSTTTEVEEVDTQEYLEEGESSLINKREIIIQDFFSN